MIYETFPGAFSAACLDVGVDIFWRPPGMGSAGVAEAKALCACCSVRPACREYAIRHEAHGFWGGMSARARTRERKALGLTVSLPGARSAHRRMIDDEMEEDYDHTDR